MKYTLEQLRKLILPMIQSMPIEGEATRNDDGSYTFTAKGDAGPVTDAIVELIRQDREVPNSPAAKMREDSDVAAA